MNISNRCTPWIAALLFGLTAGSGLAASSFELHARSRVRSTADTNQFQAVETTLNWDPTRTAVVICDMWDKHHCPDATERVGEMAPRMNEMIKAARAKGALIIHCPSDTMSFYTNHPGRRFAQSAPKVETTVPLQGWCSLISEREGRLPIDDSDGGCDGCPDCPSYKAWTRQHPALEILPGDAITDSAEAYYLMRQRGITNVIVMGVHINMCVLGRPFAIRQMVQQGQNVVLVRDMTDSMYNHRKAPYVSHFRGTGLMVEHIEKFWCPSITSADFLGGEPFHFKGDTRKEVVFIIGENEYHTWETLPEFARAELDWRGYQTSFVTASEKVDDNDFKNWEVISRADLLVISTRRRTPPKPMMDALRAHVAAGKPVVGIRTASHAFEIRDQKEPTDTTWPRFDTEVLGGDYQDHYGTGPGKTTVVKTLQESAGNPILNNVTPEFRSESHLYRSRDLSRTVTPLLTGQTEDGQSEVEPVAWINTRDNRRVFYTSLGGPKDFADANFRRLLLNGILWALDDFIPPAEPRPTPPVKPAAAPSAAVTPPEQLGPLSPEESAKSFQIFDDLVFEQVLAEPDIAQPVFLTFDERGRMWVVEYRQYPEPAGLKMVSRDNFWRAVYDKVPDPPPRHVRGADRITIHEDTDGDGRFDKHRTFLDGLNIATSVAFGRGGVYVLNPPYLLFYPDANRDDAPDGDPQVLLSGFGLEDTHSIASSLRWGPDGWLYGCQGSTVTGNILVYGADGKALSENQWAAARGRPAVSGGDAPMKPVYSQGQNIWRYHPARRTYEVFSEGGGNAFGLEVDSAGRIFSGHNGGNTRGFHYQQGAYLQKGFDKHGPLSNPYAFGYFPQMPHPDVDRFTHNFVIYDSGALGEKYQGRLFGVEPLQGRIVMSEITPDGSTFRTRDLGHPVKSSDTWFRPVDIKLGPDGALYIADWYDRQVNHYRNHEGQIDQSNGRVYRLRARTPSDPAPKLAGKSPDELLAYFGHSNRWVRFEALRLLGDQADHIPPLNLEEILRESSPDASLYALWTLHLAGRLDARTVEIALAKGGPQARAWTVRLLGDRWQVAPELASPLAQLASAESNIEVRAQLAATARRLPAAQGLPIVKALLAHDADAGDPRQPLLLWWAIEDKCGTDRDAVLALFS
ncbi:MAG: ThuA domain-containing protein, partial [Verrucomicrobiae bacterium]|nr:ThuA domain-containing protein [Verrucomicrobiae bacterium]